MQIGMQRRLIGKRHVTHIAYGQRHGEGLADFDVVDGMESRNAAKTELREDGIIDRLVG